MGTHRQTQTYRQTGDLISLLSFFGSRLKIMLVLVTSLVLFSSNIEDSYGVNRALKHG
jgi:hypothetical protein